MQPDTSNATETLPRPTSEPAAPDVDRRIREVVVLRFAWTLGGAGVVWGGLYLLLGATGAALYPLAFSLFTIANGFVYRATRRFRLFAGVEVALILIVPALLSVRLGGFAASGAVILWSSLAPLGAMMVLGRRAAVWAIAGFIAAAATSVAVQGRVQPGDVLPPLAIEMFAFLNVIAVSGVAVATVRTFVDTTAELGRQQEKLRQLERAYLSQELLMRQQERLATLGRLSAGVAHELNNPAAAASRATEQLAAVVDRMGTHPAGLLDAGLTAEQLERVRAATRGDATNDPLERSDRAEALAQWLQAGGVAEPWELAEALVDMGADRDALGAAGNGLEPEQVVAAARWIADTEQSLRLLGDVRRSAQRISEIVRALKGYSHMDRAAEQHVDVIAGIEDTLVILRSKLGSITIRREFETDLPAIWGNAGELNQAWTNLIANAAEALDGKGTITLRVSGMDTGVRIEVEDDGPGIPPEIMHCVFEPFVTTKPPGEGTGLGLNLVHRTIVERHRGTIDVQSKPGCTRFTITLPAHQETDG
jgi:signal transduction histidine kinase